MKQKILIKSLLHLIGFGFIAKALSIIAKIITTRAIGVEGMGYFSLISPIMLTLYTLGQIGLPTAITKLISLNYEKRYQIMISSLFIGIIINIILLFLLHSFTPFIAINLLKNPNTLSSIYMLGLLTPLVFISGTIKGYLFGVNKIKISSISQVTEEIARILFVLFFYDFITTLNPTNSSMFAVVALIVAEIAQILTQIILNYRCFDRNYNKFKHELFNKSNYIFNEIISTSLPVSSTRIITTLTYFFEPIIFINIMSNLGYSSTYISKQYGLLESYAIPIIFLPGFFSSAMSTFLLPNMTSLIAKNQYKKAKKLLIVITVISLIIGVFSSLICFFFPEFLLSILYKNKEAKDFVKILAFPFIIYYIEAPISCAMYALSKEKESLIICFISSIIRVLSLFILVPKYYVLGTAYSTIIEILIIITLDLFFIIRFFKNKTNFPLNN